MGVPAVIVMGGVVVEELDPPPRVAATAPAIAPPANPTPISTLAVLLNPGPPPAMLVWVITAFAVCPA